jgi:hypothetical protein
MLICFASYLCWSKFDPNSPTHIVSHRPRPAWAGGRGAAARRGLLIRRPSGRRCFC